MWTFFRDVSHVIRIIIIAEKRKKTQTTETARNKYVLRNIRIYSIVDGTSVVSNLLEENKEQVKKVLSKTLSPAQPILPSWRD